ncbi:hypothetical protein [Hirschia baltica]|uniref:Uncharacterized protein n=1 Tax=Hirschia baltica (strain ATCC 49814 / DSM 5838 / IFAM 1418) TaxID=582402 RepID=C6XRE2_HIRBI|nr:hypothetical protein [Hirschia baltica]ACT58774.1 hypothetical protein Hbal_1080 [Hirschia baltica ATCC 49814]
MGRLILFAIVFAILAAFFASFFARRGKNDDDDTGSDPDGQDNVRKLSDHRSRDGD